MLTAAANQILSIIAPAVSTLVSATVVVDEQATTASTNGVWIRMPVKFCGRDVLAEPDIAVGLLAHEGGHFFQPLEEMDRVEKEHGVPHWLGNVLLDIHGESLIETVFPAFGAPLSAVRQAAARIHMNDYDATLRDGRASFAEKASAAALKGRFYDPRYPFATFGEPDDRLYRFLTELSRAIYTPVKHLPDLAVRIVNTFPELKHTQPPEGLGNPLDGISSGGDALPAVRREASPADNGQRVPGGGSGSGSGHIRQSTFSRQPPHPDAVRMARYIQPRFEQPRGSITLAAPGRLDRLELARGAAIPFRMDVPPGVDRPAPQVVIALDRSGSMNQEDKLRRAQIAAQAIALAVHHNGGDVRSLLFDDLARIARDFGDDPLFAGVHAAGGTSLLFLPAVWRRFPRHQVFVVTDGDGAIPLALPVDRRRTVAVLIPPQTRSDLMRQVADTVISIDRLDDLPWLLGMMIPRTRVA
jgi:hypothetical protein